MLKLNLKYHDIKRELEDRLDEGFRPIPLTNKEVKEFSRRARRILKELKKRASSTK